MAPDEFTIALPGDAQAAGIARKFVHEHRDDLPASLIEDAQLLVSEVVTNAVLHGEPDITLAMHVTGPGLGFVVTDSGEGRPVRPDHRPESDRPYGRGLFILDALATAWGVTDKNPTPGKSVWFDLAPN